MSKFVKGLIQSELEKVLVQSKIREFLVMELKGINGVDNNVVRADLRKKGVRVMVVSNALFRRALVSQKMDAAAGLVAGPCAIAFGGDSIVDAAKLVTEWTKKVKAIKVKGAYLDGAVLDSAGAEALAKMPNRKELQAQIAGAIRSPAGRVAGAVAGPAGLIAGCLKAMADKGDKQAA